MCFISIIMPVYNSEQYVETAIRSVLTQSFNDFELICIDDGSTDSSGKICDEISAEDSRLKVVHISNSGISHARNTGLKMAKGEYIGFCDNDDIFLPNALEDNVLLLKENKADVVRWNFESIYYDRQGNIKNRYKREFKSGKFSSKEEIAQNYLEIRQTIGEIWTGLYRREYLDKYNILFDEFMHFGGEDTAFNIEVLRHCPNIILNNRCYYNWYVRRNHSTSEKRDANFSYSMIKNMRNEYEVAVKILEISFESAVWLQIQKQYFDYIISYSKRFEWNDKLLIWNKLLEHDSLVNITFNNNMEREQLIEYFENE